MQPLIDWYHSHQLLSWAGIVFAALLVSRYRQTLLPILKSLFAKPASGGNIAGGQSANADSSEQTNGESRPKTQLGFDPQRPQIVAIEFDMSNVDHVRIYHTTKELIAKCPEKAINLVQQSQPTTSQASAGGAPA